MFDMTKETGVFHNIYKTGIGAETEKRILHEGNESGEGTMRRFEVAPGIQITYNDLKMDSCFRPIRFEKDFLQINHCLEGCYECELEGGSVSFLGEGDLCVDYLSKDRQVFLGSRIPLKKYRGITVLLEMEPRSKPWIRAFNKLISVGTDKRTPVFRWAFPYHQSKHEIDHIFSEFYSVDERIQVPYFWIKVIELLLFLSLLDGSAVCRPQQFSADISKRTQDVYQYIIENPFTKDTIQDLACMFGLAESSLKRCFKSIAGASIGTFIKTKRMEAAAELLVSEPALSIGEIGSVAGYENQSKFSAAFKSVMSVTPQAYRHKYY